MWDSAKDWCHFKGKVGQAEAAFLLEKLFQVAQPSEEEVAVLEQHPVPAGASRFQVLERERTLSLPEGHGLEPVVRVEADRVDPHGRLVGAALL